MKKLGAIVMLIAAVLYFNFGTLSPCGMLRENVRQRDGLAAVLPDSIVDLAMAAQYGALSPGRCISILLERPSTPTPNIAQATQQPIVRQQATQAPPSTPPANQDALRAALKETEQAATECKAKRLSGELPTHAASAQCANPRMIQAFNAAHYRYMDLIQFFAAKRVELAQKIDRRELTEEQAQLQITNVYASIVDAEGRRDTATR